jgi:ribosomal subunit interface protein
MHIAVSGKQLDVGESLREHVESRIQEAVHKYLERVTAADIVISKESHLFRADIVVNTGTHAGIPIKASGQASDVYAAFEAAEMKIEKQLRRYKRKITNHHKGNGPEAGEMPEPMKGKKYVISNADEHISEMEDAPLVIAEKSTDIQTLTVSEAVMRMDLSDLPALMFFNSANGRVNVIYKRQDGNISWVDPEEKVA